MQPIAAAARTSARGLSHAAPSGWMQPIAAAARTSAHGLSHAAAKFFRAQGIRWFAQGSGNSLDHSLQSIQSESTLH